MDNANTNRKKSINIPALTLEELSEYYIKVNFENFLGQVGAETFEIKTKAKDGIAVNIK